MLAMRLLLISGIGITLGLALSLMMLDLAMWGGLLCVVNGGLILLGYAFYKDTNKLLSK